MSIDQDVALPHARDEGAWMRSSGNLFASMELKTEIELVTVAKVGDHAAFSKLVRCYQRAVYRLAFAMTRNPDAAAALTRDTFVRAWKGIKDFPDGRRFFPWLLRIARNLSVAQARHRPPNPKPGEADILTLFGELRPDEQMALALRVVERHRYDTIAALLDVSIGIAVLRLSQTRGHLLARTAPPGEGRA